MRGRRAGEADAAGHDTRGDKAGIVVDLDAGELGAAAVKAAVQAELSDLIARESKPGGTIYLSHIRAAISAAVGEDNYTMSAPSADVTNTAGNMTTLGTITWL